MTGSSAAFDHDLADEYERRYRRYRDAWDLVEADLRHLIKITEPRAERLGLQEALRVMGARKPR